jgi:hypothetical protein
MISAYNGGGASTTGRTVVVGVKMESNSHHSTELLTWSLVNVAQPGDLILALHVLRNDGNSFFFLSYLNAIFYLFVFGLNFDFFYLLLE